MDVGYQYMQAFQDLFSALPSVRAIAKSANISKKSVTKVAAELASTGQLTDPDIAQDETDNQVGTGAFLVKEEVVFLLSLQAESSNCPNKDYASTGMLYEILYGT